MTAFLLVSPPLLKFVGSDSGLPGNREGWEEQTQGRRGLRSIESRGVGLTLAPIDHTGQSFLFLQPNKNGDFFLICRPPPPPHHTINS